MINADNVKAPVTEKNITGKSAGTKGTEGIWGGSLRFPFAPFTGTAQHGNDEKAHHRAPLEALDVQLCPARPAALKQDRKTDQESLSISGMVDRKNKKEN